jgi:hypothetical protein
MFLLTIALQVFTLMEFVVRRQLATANKSIAGLYDGNPQRTVSHDLGFCFLPLLVFRNCPIDPCCLSGLTFAPQTDTASPAAKMLCAALISRSWIVPQLGHSHSLMLSGNLSIFPIN